MLDKKVLVIDDERLIRNTTVLLLKKNGARAFAASSGPEGIEMARREQPDLILLDIMMPEMNGWQVLEKLQQDSVCPGAAVIIFTAVDFAASRKEAAARGAQGILRKPFHLHELKAILGIADQREGANG